jgi:hypothetical protein
MGDTLDYNNNYVLVDYNDDYVNLIAEDEYIDLEDLSELVDKREYLNKRIKYLSNLLNCITDKYEQNPYSEKIIRRISRITIEINNLNNELTRNEEIDKIINI